MSANEPRAAVHYTMVELEEVEVNPPTPTAGAPPAAGTGTPPVATPKAAASFKPAEPKRGGLVQIGPCQNLLLYKFLSRHQLDLDLAMSTTQ